MGLQAPVQRSNASKLSCVIGELQSKIIPTMSRPLSMMISPTANHAHQLPRKLEVSRSALAESASEEISSGGIRFLTLAPEPVLTNQARA